MFFSSTDKGTCWYLDSSERSVNILHCDLTKAYRRDEVRSVCFYIENLLKYLTDWTKSAGVMKIPGRWVSKAETILQFSLPNQNKNWWDNYETQ